MHKGLVVEYLDRGARGRRRSCSPATTSATSRRSRPSPTCARRACPPCWSARPPTRRAPSRELVRRRRRRPRRRPRPAPPAHLRRARPRDSPDVWSASRRYRAARRDYPAAIQHHPACGSVCTHGETAGATVVAAHREGLRERPCEVPATVCAPPASGTLRRQSRERCQIRPVARVATGKMRRRSSMSSTSRLEKRRTPPLRDGAFGHAPCPRLPRVRPRGRARPALRLSGVLRTARGRLRLRPAPVTREQIEAGPPNIWRYKALLPVPDDIEQSPNTEPGFTRLLRAAQPRPRARHRQALGQGRLDQPDQLLQGPRRGLRAERGPRARRQGLRLPLDRQPGQRGGRRRCPGRHQDRRLHPERPREAQAGQLRRLHRARWSR